MEAFQNHYKDVLTIGRDMIRVVCQLALRYKLPEFAAVWTNQLLNQASYEITDYKGGMGAVLNEPTRGRYLQSRVTTEMERQLSFLMTGVKMGNQRRYQTWFQQKFMITPESELLAVDLVRYICDVFHPPHHIVTGNFVARWAMLGWLLKSIKNHVVLEQVYQAVIWDWIFCNRNESVMCLEPTMLLMVNSIPRYADITIHVLNTLFHAVDHTLIPPEQVGKNLTEAMRILSKFGIGGVDRLIDCNIIEVPLREKIKKYFGSFVPGNANSPTAQPNSPTTSPQPFTVPPPTLTPPQQPVSPTQSPTAGSPFAVPPSSPTTNKAVPIRPVKKPQAPQSPSKPQLSSILVEPQDTVMAEQEDNHDAQSPVQPQRQADLLSPISTADALAPKTPVEGDMDASIKNIINGFISGKAQTDSSEFDGHLETLGKAISDYIQNNSNKSKADEAIVKTLDVFEKSSTVTEGATQQLATVIVRLLGFEFSVLNQEEHTQRVLAHSDETLTWTLLDTINKILMPMLVPDKTAQNNNNKLKQPTRRPKGSKQVKDRFSSFLKHACMADPSMGYRVLCYCIKSFQATKQPIDKTNLQLTCSLVQLALNESNKETYTFYEYVIHLRKTQQQGTLAPSVFLSDIKSIVHENQTLFMILLPIITRDFAHYVKRIKLPILRLVAGLSPSQVNDVVGSVESGFVKIIYSKRMTKPSTTQEDSDPVKEVMDLLEKAWSNWKDYFELETLWEMILAELYSQQTEQYTTMLLKRVKQRDRQERGLDDQEDEDDDEQLEIDKGEEESQQEQFMSLDLNQFLMTLLMNENFRENMTAHSMNKLQALILRLAAFIQQQEQRLGLNPSSAQHLLNFDCVKCIVTLPHDKFHHFASVLLHQYMQFNQQSEQFFITLVKAYDDDPLPVLTTLSHIKQLEMTQTKVHPNLNRGSRSRGLFSNERFIKQLSANKEKWKKRAGTIMTVLLTEAKKPTPPTGPPASTIKKVKPVAAAVPIIPEKRNPSKRVKRRRLPWDEETEDDFIVSDEDEIEEETSTPTEDNDEDDIEEEEEEAEGTQPPNSPGGDSDEYKDEDKEAEDDHNMSDDNSNRRSKRVSRRRVVDDEETKPNKKKRPREEEKKDEEEDDEEGEEGSDNEEKEDSDSEDDPELKTMKNIRKRRTSSGRTINKFTK
jgi:integrator complex subunit 3